MRKFTFLLITLLCQLNDITAQPPRADKNIVMEYFQNMEYEEAISYLLSAQKTDSVNLQLLGYLGYAYYMNEEPANAGKYYNKMLDIDSMNVTANQFFATYYSSDDPVTARVYMYRLIQFHPKKAVYYRKMGDLFRRKNQKDSAFLYFEQAYRLLPGDSKNGSALADLLLDQKEYPRADSIIDEGLLKDSLNVAYNKLRIRSAYETTVYQQALIPGERLIRLGEGTLTALTQLALSYYNLKLYRDCIRVCEYLDANGMGGENAYYYAAKAHAKLGAFEKSNELLRTCLELSISTTAEFYFYALGENFESMKQYKMAIPQYDTAYYLFKNPLMLYNSGRIWDGDLKNYTAAKKYYDQYIRLAKPQTAEEKKAYNYIREKYYKKVSKGKPAVTK